MAFKPVKSSFKKDVFGEKKRTFLIYFTLFVGVLLLLLSSYLLFKAYNYRSLLDLSFGPGIYLFYFLFVFSIFLLGFALFLIRQKKF